MPAIESELAEHLEDQAIGTVGTDIFYSKMPADVDNCIGVLHTGGSGASMAGPKRNLTFQIVVRNTNIDTAKAKANSIRQLLHADDSTNQTDYDLPSGSRVLTGFAIQEPYNLGQDENNRYEVVANYQLTIAN